MLGSMKQLTAAAAAAGSPATGWGQSRLPKEMAGSGLQTSIAHVVLGEPHYGPFYRAQSTFYAAFMQYGAAGSGQL